MVAPQQPEDDKEPQKESQNKLVPTSEQVSIALCSEKNLVLKKLLHCSCDLLRLLRVLTPTKTLRGRPRSPRSWR